MSETPQRIGRYELVDRLGEGGMGTLYLARDPALGRTVAIKLLSVQTAELRERFEREARAAAALKHYNIVTIYDVGEEQGQPFIAMEFVAGETLGELVRRRAPLAPSRKLELLEELCDGLGYAHRAGIVHRDIKPANVMVSAEGALKILDFGLARVVSGETQPELTRAGVMVGTPHYMSPEQIEGRPIDHRSDIFSVGLLIYELLSYQKAYPGDSPYAVVHKILTTDPEPLERVCPGVDPALSAVVARAIQKDPARRFQDLATLGAELARIRLRLVRTATEPTIVLPTPAAEDGARDAASPSPAPSPFPSPSPSPRPLSRESLTRRRTQEIQRHLEAALEHLAAGRLEQASEECEAAALIDPDNERVVAVMRQTQDALVDRQVAGLVGEAHDALGRGTLSRADGLLAEAAQLRPDAAEVLALRQAIDRARSERERLADRARAVRAALERAEGSLGQGALESALRSVSEALAHDAANDDARRLKERVLAAIEARRQEEALERRALDCVADARSTFSRGAYDEAIGLLAAFTPAHPIVERARDELATERDAILQRARETEELERRRSVEEQRKRAEAERLARERAEAEERRRRDEEQQEQVRTAGVHKASAAAALAARRFDEALAALADARAAWPGDPDVEALEQRALAARTEAEAAEQRRMSVGQTLTAAEAAAAAGDLDRARRLVDTALGIEPKSARATALGANIERAQAARRQQRELDARAQAAIAAARQRSEEGHPAAAIEDLARFSPPHPAVTEALEGLREPFEASERARLARERDEETARQARAEAEARRREETRRRRASELAASARRKLDEGDLAAARAEAAEALLLWPACEDGLAVRDLVDRASRERRERERHESLANEAIDAAQRLMAAGHAEEAAATLESFRPPHPAVTAALTHLRAEIAALTQAERPVIRPSTAPRRTLTAVAAGLVAIVVVAGGAWWWVKGRPEHPAPIATTSTIPAPPIDPGAAAVADATRLRDTGRLREALAALRGGGATPAAAQLMAALYADAAREVETAEKHAREAGASGPAFADAQQAAEKGRSAGPTESGVTAMLDAGEAFRAAAANATAPDTIVANARAAFESGQLDRALELATGIEQRDAGNASLASLVADMRSAVEHRALEERQNAERAGGGASAGFAKAAQSADAATRTPGVAGVRAWQQVSDAFAAVTLEARSALARYGKLQDLLRRGNDTAALTEAERLLAETPSDAHVSEALGTLRQRAAAAVARAKNDAQAVGARGAWPAALTEAATQESRAQAPSLSPAERIRAFWSARHAYQQAARTAREAGQAADHAIALLERGQRDEALAELETALTQYPGSPRLDEMLGTAFDAAVREADAEAAKARRANAAGTPAFRAASAEDQQGRRAGRSIEGVRAFTRAAAGYRQAVAAVAGPGEHASGSSGAGNAGTGGNAGKAGGAGTPPIDSAAGRDAMRRDIEAVLSAIADAYQAKDADRINRLLRDTMQLGQLHQIERNFKEYKSVRWQLRLSRLEPQPDGTVRATCTQIREIDVKAGSDISDSRTTVLTFRKIGDEWRVLSQTYP